MILPIITYGYSVLRKTSSEVPGPSMELDSFIQNMWDSMDAAEGVGLAAPQVNRPLNLFIVNSKLVYDEISVAKRAAKFEGDEGIIETFINAKIIAKSDTSWSDYEGCLSIPGISERVERPWEIIIEYQDRHFTTHKKRFSGYTAKVIQHEYDHIKGVLFIDHLSSLKKKLLNGKLKKIQTKKLKTKSRSTF